MNREDVNQRLSQISTMWTVLRQAHDGTADSARAAQQLLIERYGGPVRCYLLRALGDTHAADDVFQEFALALTRGAFRGADPERRRFRHYVKTVLFNLVCKHHKQKPRRPQPLPADSPELAGLAAPSEDEDREFNEKWRNELLARTWEALAQAQRVLHAVLRFRAEHPQMRSAEMAEQLGRQLGKPMTSESVRQNLSRARDRFAELLLEEVAHSLDSPTAEDLEEELADLDLLEYCRPALKQRGRC